MSDDAAESQDIPVANQVVGDIEGAVVQARDIHGDVQIGAGGSPELHATPLVVSLDSHDTYLVGTASSSNGVDEDIFLVPVSGSHVLKVLLEARSAQAVVLRALRATVLSRRPPLPVRQSMKIMSALAVRPFTINLDSDTPQVVADNVDFPFSVTASDPEMLAIRPLSTVDEVQWQLELDWTYAGRRGTTVIPEHGRGFLLYPRH